MKGIERGKVYRGERDREGESERESKIIVKFSKPRNKAQTSKSCLGKMWEL